MSELKAQRITFWKLIQTQECNSSQRHRYAFHIHVAVGCGTEDKHH